MEGFDLEIGGMIAISTVFSGILGVVLNRKNFLIAMMCIELTYLGAGMVLVLASIHFHDFSGQVYALFLIIIAAAEAALGLGLLIVSYRAEGRIDFPHFVTLRT